MLEKIADGIAVEGMESLAPVLVDGMEPLLDLLPAGTHVVLIDPEKVRTRAHDLVATSEEFLAASWANASAGNATPSTCPPWIPGRPRRRRPTGRSPGVRDHAGTRTGRGGSLDRR